MALKVVLTVPTNVTAPMITSPYSIAIGGGQLSYVLRRDEAGAPKGGRERRCWEETGCSPGEGLCRTHGAETPAEPREIHIVVRFTTHGGGSTAGKIVQEVGVNAMRGRVLENAKEGKNPD
jgi:hypothetical protein